MNIIKKTVVVLSFFVLSGSFMFAKEKSENPFDGTEPKLNYNNRVYNLDGINVVIASYMRENNKNSTTKSTRDY